MTKYKIFNTIGWGAFIIFLATMIILLMFSEIITKDKSIVIIYFITFISTPVIAVICWSIAERIKFKKRMAEK